MPIIRLNEIHNMSTTDRMKKLEELRAELSRMRTMIRAGGAVENPTRVRELRKTIARIKTIENEYAKNIRNVNNKDKKPLIKQIKTSKKGSKEKKTK